MFASGIGNTGFAAVVIDDDDEIGCFGAAVGLAGSFFTVLSVVLIFEEVVPDDACEARGDLLLFPNDWAATGTLVVDDPPKAALLFI